MISQECLQEFRAAWLPHITDTGLDRVIELLEKGSPLLISGSFSRAMPMGCLATHIAWHHPRTAHLTQDAGICWLFQEAHLNPATSSVIREWDNRGAQNWETRAGLLEVLHAEKASRAERPTTTTPYPALCLQ